MRGAFELKKLLPKKLFNISSYDKIAYAVRNSLNTSFERISEELTNEKISQYYNIIGVLYPYLNKLLCGEYFSNYEIKCLKLDSNLSLEYFQSVNQTNNVPIKSMHRGINKIPNNSKKFFYKISEFKKIKHEILNYFYSNNYDAKKVLFLPNVSMLKKEDFLKNGIKLELLPSQIYFPSVLKNQQWEIFSDQIDILESRLAKIFGENICIREYVRPLIKKEFFRFCKDKEALDIKADYVLTGSVINLLSRIVCANAKIKGVKVIQIWHGNSIGALDEPMFSQDEKTYCDYIIGPAEFGCKTFSKLNGRDLFKKSIKSNINNFNKTK